MRVVFEQLRDDLLGELDAYALLVQADAQLLAGIIGREAKHLAGPHQRIIQQQVVKDITPTEAYELVQKNKGNPNFVIVDVRTQAEFDEERIEGALLIDYYLPNFEDELKKLDKKKTYLVYCRTARRSDDAVLIMKKMGFREVYNMVGGIVGWKAAKLPLVK